MLPVHDGKPGLVGFFSGGLVDLYRRTPVDLDHVRTLNGEEGFAYSKNVTLKEAPEKIRTELAAPSGKPAEEISSAWEKPAPKKTTFVVGPYKGTKPAGYVVYNDARVEIPPEAVDAGFVENFQYFWAAIASDDPGVKVPTAGECRYCDIAKSECPERVEA